LMWALEGLDMWIEDHQAKSIPLPQRITDLRDSHLSGQSVYEEFVTDWFSFGTDDGEPHFYYRCHRTDVREMFAWWLLNEKKDMTPLDHNDKRMTKVYDLLDQKCRAGQPVIGDRQGKGWFGVHLISRDERGI